MAEQVPDHIEALRLFLRANTEIAALISGRAFAGEIPSGEQKSMPRAAILVVPAGGGQGIGSGYANIGDQRADVFCYGATPKSANDLWRVVYPTLKQLRRAVFAECLLHWARKGGGPMPVRDPKTDWPYTFSSWQVLVSEVAVPG
jgi:hypothetical protein